jgi:hypothetical protein
MTEMSKTSDIGRPRCQRFHCERFASWQQMIDGRFVCGHHVRGGGPAERLSTEVIGGPAPRKRVDDRKRTRISISGGLAERLKARCAEFGGFEVCIDEVADLAIREALDREEGR